MNVYVTLHDVDKCLEIARRRNPEITEDSALLWYISYNVFGKRYQVYEVEPSFGDTLIYRILDATGPRVIKWSVPDDFIAEIEDPGNEINKYLEELR